MKPEFEDLPSSTAATPSPTNSDLQDLPPSVDAPALPGEAPDVTQPIDSRGRDDIGAPTPSVPEEVVQPKAPSKNARSEAKPKEKPQSKRKSTKVAGVENDAAEEPEVTGDGANSPSHEAAPISACLQVPQLDLGELSPPATTLPPQLNSLFPSMPAVSAVLAATAAAIGHGVRLDTNMNGGDSSSALRVAIVGEERRLPPVIASVLQAAYALEQAEVQRWSTEKQKVDLLGAADAVRRRLYRQTLANAGLLGLAGISDSLNPTIMTPSSDLPRPRFVLRDPSQTDVTRALEAAESGVLLVDGRRLPTMVGFGINYDTLTANLLNTAAAGRPLELADPRLADCVRMRPVAASVIGTLSTLDTFGLHKAGPAALDATIFALADEKSKPVSPANAVTALAEILGRVRSFTASAEDAGLPLRLSAAARKTLEQAKTRLARASAAVLPPLAHYYAATTDLVRRIVVVLHVLDHAARNADQVSVEVGNDVVTRAVAFVEQCVLPAARITLAVSSVAPEVRDARRIVSFAQQYASAVFPLLMRRDVVRLLQRSMSVASVDHALRRLVADALLTASSSDAAKGGGHVFQVHPAVFDANNQLPDLVTDPRRPKP